MLVEITELKQNHTCNCGACIEMPKLFLEGKPVDGLRSHHTCLCDACVANLYFDGKDVSGMRDEHTCGCDACIGNTNSIIDILQLIKSKTASKEYYYEQRWSGHMHCPWCQYKKIYHLADDKFKCSRCRKKFTNFTKTHLAGIKILHTQISYVLGMFVMGIPAFRLRKRSDLSKATIQRLYRLFREAIYDSGLIELKRLSAKLEFSETLLKDKKIWGTKRKHIILGLYKKNGSVIIFPVTNRKKATLEPLISRGSIYYTDKNEGYVKLAVQEKYVQIIEENGKTKSRNGLQEFWDYVKLWLRHYKTVRSDNFHLYLKEIEFRFNNRQKASKEKYLFDEVVQLLVRE